MSETEQNTGGTLMADHSWNVDSGEDKVTILELLCNEEKPCHVQGQRTRIIRNWDTGFFEVLQIKSKFRKGDYTVELYAGESEEDAVTAFQIGERT